MASQPQPGSTASPKSPRSPSHPQPSPAHNDTAIEVSEDVEEDFFDSESDPGYITDASSTYTHSITSSVRQHVYEGGLRYHAFRDGKYAFPNDETEQNRDDMKHAMTLLLCDGKLHYAPIGPNPLNIIDLGTGSGIWVMEMAEKYPSASILGVDLSPIQPTWVPPNVKFLVDDVEDVWLHPKDHYDYVHVRHTMHSIRNRAQLLSRALRHLKPGGYMECQELDYHPCCDDDSMTEPYPFKEFIEGIGEGLAALGSDSRCALKIATEMAQAGFVDVQEIRLKCPFGIWPRDKKLKMAGLYWRTAIMDGLYGLANRAYGRGLQWTKAEIEVFLVDVRKSLMDTSKHSYFPLRIVYGQKPMP